MTTIAIHRTQDGVLTSADTALLSITTGAGASVVSMLVVAPTSAGVYSYTTTTLPVGLYTATWTFQVAGRPDDQIQRIFQVEQPLAAARGITLAEIERRVAARLGPYHRYRAKLGSTASTLLVAKLRTSLDLGDYEDLFMLRRGRTADDALVASFDPDDRQRLVASYDGTIGALTPDQAWTNAPITDESVELHLLEPEEELRAAALLGLERCYFEDTLEIAATTYLREVNLSDAAPWITRPSQVRRVDYGRSSYNPHKAPWFEPFQRGSDVWLRTAVPSVGTVRIAALRPHSSYVNGEDSLVGPDADDDVLYVPPRYAALAGQMGAWEIAPAKLAPVATQGLTLQMKQVADAFTVASMAYCKLSPEIIQNHFGQDDVLTSLQLGNA